MQVDGIASNTYAIGETTFFGVANVGFGYGKFRLDAAGLSDIGSHCKTVFCAEILGSQPEMGVTLTAVISWSLGLKPIYEGESVLLCKITVMLCILAVKEVAKEEVVLRPVHQCYIIRMRAIGEEVSADDAPVLKEGGRALCRPVGIRRGTLQTASPCPWMN